MLETLVFLLFLFGGAAASRSFRIPPPGDITPPPGAPPQTPPVPLPPSPAPPWPSPVPSTLPPFPSGWEPDNPPPPEVVKRAWELLPVLWKTGQGAKTTEMTGGRWITYLADWHGVGIKGVNAFRIKGSKPVGRRPDTNVPSVDPAIAARRARR